MTTANRFDTYKLDAKAIKLDSGFLKVPAHVTRAGIFQYRRADGTVRRELRHPDEVFKADSLSTFAGIPVTNRHPSELVTSSNVKKYMVGVTADNPKQDGDFVETVVTLMDQKIIDEVEKQGLREVSCGYKCDVVFEPGVYKGEHYDARQTNIRGNHLAIVDRGRAGREVKLRLDSEDAELILEGESPRKDRLDKPNNGGSHMTKVTINGVQYDASEALASAIASENEKKDKALADVKAELESTKTDGKKEKDEIQAKLDQVTEERDKMKKDAEEAPKVKDLVSARMKLVSQATPHLDKETLEKLDEMDDKAVKVAVIKSKSEKFDEEGRSDDYINARFDAIMETEPKKDEKKDNPLILDLHENEKSRKDGEEKTAAEIRADNMKRDSELWQQPLAHSLEAVGGK
jgi:hypothetical protein